MSPARARRTVAAVVTVWLFGLVLVLGLWQRVDAVCGDGASDAPVDCPPLPPAEPTVGGARLGG